MVPLLVGVILRTVPSCDLTVFLTDPPTLAAPTNTLRRTSRIEFAKPFVSNTELAVKKKRDVPSPVLGHTWRKPTLIRHLGGAGGPKGMFE